MIPGNEVKVFAPASVSNIGPGFDCLGMAVSYPGDLVVARKSAASSVRLISIENDNGLLPIEADRNTAGIAASLVLEMLGIHEGVDLELSKGMPCQSGLGSSGASAVAAAYAVNLLFGGLLSKEELVRPCMEAEATVSGSAHADNVAPSLLGGLVAVQTHRNCEVVAMEGFDGLPIVLAHPQIEISTKMARASLPKKIELAQAVGNWGATAAMGYAIAMGDLDLFCKCIHDPIIEPLRAALLPCYGAVKAAALEAGAMACALSGSGPTLFAIASEQEDSEAVGEAMEQIFQAHRIPVRMYLTAFNSRGAVAIEV